MRARRHYDVLVMSEPTEPALSTAPPDAAAGALPLSPGDWRLAAWRSFLRTHTHLLRLLEQDLQAHHKIALGSYDVLVQLAEAPEQPAADVRAGRGGAAVPKRPDPAGGPDAARRPGRPRTGSRTTRAGCSRC